MNKTVSFKFTLLQVFTVLMLVTVLTVLLTFYVGASRAIYELAEEISTQVSNKIIERTDDFLTRPSHFARYNAKLVRGDNLIDAHERLWSMMWEELQTAPQAQSILLADTEGSYVQVRSFPRLATRLIDRRAATAIPQERWYFRDPGYGVVETLEREPTFDPRTRPWYESTGEAEQRYWSEVFVFTTAQTPGITVSFPILGSDGGLAGVSAVNVSLNKLSEFIARQKVSQNGIAYIINQDGALVAYPDPAKTMKPDPAEAGSLATASVEDLDQPHLVDAYRAFRNSGESRVVTETGGRRYITLATPFGSEFDKNWHIIVTIPEDDILGGVKTMALRALLAAALILLASLLVVIWVTNLISRPIEQLAGETDKIKNFNLEDFRGVQSRFREVALMNDSLEATTKGLKSFRKYVPAELVRRLIALGEETELGGDDKLVTLFFSDIAGFTTISESMPAEKLMIHLSGYLDELTRIVMHEQGTIDKYIGDAIMAFWGAPEPIENHAAKACRAALACQRRIAELNPVWTAQGLPELNTRIGLHTGHAVIGNMGSSDRMNYTAIGDSVNLAARLEGVNKMYGTSIIISEQTHELIGDAFISRALDVVAVKGKQQGVRIYELVAASEDETLDPEQRSAIAAMNTAFEHYLARNWQEAENGFSKYLRLNPGDISATSLIERCHDFQQSQTKLPEFWDGTVALKSK